MSSPSFNYGRERDRKINGSYKRERGKSGGNGDLLMNMQEIAGDMLLVIDLTIQRAQNNFFKNIFN